MSPRAAWRLEALGFEQIYDYVGGKAGWLGHHLPREGEAASIPYAGDLIDCDPPTCRPADTAEVRARLDGSRYGFSLVVNEKRVVLGRVRRSAMEGADAKATAASVMEAGPSTVRPSARPADLVERLAKRDLRTAVVTAPGGQLLGVFHRAEAERRLEQAAT
jgi:hypothetical protein